MDRRRHAVKRAGTVFQKRIVERSGELLRAFEQCGHRWVGVVNRGQAAAKASVQLGANACRVFKQARGHSVGQRVADGQGPLEQVSLLAAELLNDAGTSVAVDGSLGSHAFVRFHVCAFNSILQLFALCQRKASLVPMFPVT